MKQKHFRQFAANILTSDKYEKKIYVQQIQSETRGIVFACLITRTFPIESHSVNDANRMNESLHSLWITFFACCYDQANAA